MDPEESNPQPEQQDQQQQEQPQQQAGPVDPWPNLNLDNPVIIKGLSDSLARERMRTAMQVQPEVGKVTRTPVRYVARFPAMQTPGQQPMPPAEPTAPMATDPLFAPAQPDRLITAGRMAMTPVYEGETDEQARTRAAGEDSEAQFQSMKYGAARYMDEVTFNLTRHLWTNDFEQSYETQNPEEAGVMRNWAFVASIYTMVGLPEKVPALARAAVNPAGHAINQVFKLGTWAAGAMKDAFLGSNAGAEIAAKLAASRGAATLATWGRKVFGKAVEPEAAAAIERNLGKYGGRVLEDGTIYVPPDVDATGREQIKTAFNNARSRMGSSVKLKIIRDLEPRNLTDFSADYGPVIAGGAAAGAFAGYARDTVGANFARTPEERAAYEAARGHDTRMGAAFGAAITTAYVAAPLALQKLTNRPELVRGMKEVPNLADAETKPWKGQLWKALPPGPGDK